MNVCLHLEQNTYNMESTLMIRLESCLERKKIIYVYYNDLESVGFVM